ncbi:MAG: ParB N-terminal domain-containing protein [Nitrospira sp.]|nr:ParB N-terminal domain-containing protein [Nitrospira sp.]
MGDYAVISKTGSTRKVEYLLKDRLGSVDAVANATGAITETRGYDAFGKPRDGSWNDLNPAKIASTAVTPKGFTQHEHLNQLELIHMNGRAFDYNLGRFTGVDPFIQFPLNSQSLNPYSYLLNWPLSGTDPTGYAQECSVGADKSCLQNGENTIVDGQGNNLGTITVNEKTVSYRPNAIGVMRSLNSNGAGTLGYMMANSQILRAVGQDKASAIGNATSRAALPSAIPLQQRGEQGSAWDFIAGFWTERNNAPIDAFNFGANTGAPGIIYGMLTGKSLDVPRLELSNKQLKGAFVYDVLNLMSAAFAPRAVGGKAPEAGTPSMRKPAAGRGTAETANETVDPNTLQRTHSIEGKRSAARVDELSADMRQNGYSGPPVDVAEINGGRYILDGHHRRAAAARTGTLVEIRVIKDIQSHPSSFGSADDVLRAGESVGPDRLGTSRR